MTQNEIESLGWKCGPFLGLKMNTINGKSELFDAVAYKIKLKNDNIIYTFIFSEHESTITFCDKTIHNKENMYNASLLFFGKINSIEELKEVMNKYKIPCQ